MKSKRFFIMTFLMVWGVAICISFCGMNNADAWGLKGALDKVKKVIEPEPEGETSDEKKNEEIRNDSATIGTLGGAVVGNLVGDETGAYIGALVGSIAGKIYAEQLIKMEKESTNVANATEEEVINDLEKIHKNIKKYNSEREKASTLQDEMLTEEKLKKHGKIYENKMKELQEKNAKALAEEKRMCEMTKEAFNVRKERLKNLQKPLERFKVIKEIDKEIEELTKSIDKRSAIKLDI